MCVCVCPPALAARSPQAAARRLRRSHCRLSHRQLILMLMLRPSLSGRKSRRPEVPPPRQRGRCPPIQPEPRGAAPLGVAGALTWEEASPRARSSAERAWERFRSGSSEQLSANSHNAGVDFYKVTAYVLSIYK